MRDGSRWAARGLIVLGLASCTPSPAASAPSWLLEAAEAGQALPAGTVTGSVRRLDGQAFAPAAGVAVALEDGRAVLTDARGAFAFERVAPGRHTLTASAPGCHPAQLALLLPGATGLGRVHLPLVPLAAPGGLAMGTVAGVVVDARGAAVPQATVRCVDSASEGGHQTWRADGDGFYLGTIAHRGPGPAVASLTAHGRTAGGVAVEATAIQPLALTSGRTYAPVVVADRWEPVRGARLAGREGDEILVTASRLPTRPEELVGRFATPLGDHEALPSVIEDGRARFRLPAGATRLTLLSLGLESPEAPQLTLE